jgi:hypothetical protein
MSVNDAPAGSTGGLLRAAGEDAGPRAGASCWARTSREVLADPGRSRGQRSRSAAVQHRPRATAEQVVVGAAARPPTRPGRRWSRLSPESPRVEARRRPRAPHAGRRRPAPRPRTGCSTIGSRGGRSRRRPPSRPPASRPVRHRSPSSPSPTSPVRRPHLAPVFAVAMPFGGDEPPPPRAALADSPRCAPPEPVPGDDAAEQPRRGEERHRRRCPSRGRGAQEPRVARDRDTDTVSAAPAADTGATTTVPTTPDTDVVAPTPTTVADGCRRRRRGRERPSPSPRRRRRRPRRADRGRRAVGR